MKGISSSWAIGTIAFVSGSRWESSPVFCGRHSQENEPGKIYRISQPVPSTKQKEWMDTTKETVGDLLR